MFWNVDITPPIITLKGVLLVTLQSGVDTYLELGATAADSFDGIITTIIITSDIPVVRHLGLFNVTYSASDSAGNRASINRSVRVIDTLPPVLTLLPDDKMVLVTAESNWSDPGYTATDSHQGNITNLVVVSGDSFKPGPAGKMFTLVYTVADLSGNVASKTRKVVITGKPASKSESESDLSSTSSAPVAIIGMLSIS